MGNTCSKGPFSIAMLVYRSVIFKFHHCVKLTEVSRFVIFQKIRGSFWKGGVPTTQKYSALIFKPLKDRPFQIKTKVLYIVGYVIICMYVCLYVSFTNRGMGHVCKETSPSNILLFPDVFSPQQTAFSKSNESKRPPRRYDPVVAACQHQASPTFSWLSWLHNETGPT